MSLKSPVFVLALAVTLAATGGAAAKTYQKSKAFTCAALGFSGICTATFPKIKSGQRLTITHVSCVIGISNVGQEVIAKISAVGASPVFPGNINTAKPKHYLIWQYFDDSHFDAVVSSALSFEVKAGTAPEVVLFTGSSAPLIGNCTISGKVVKL